MSESIFVYRDNLDDGRDCVAYVESDAGPGSKAIHGPCYWSSVDSTSFGAVPLYENLDTILTEEQFDRFRDEGMDDDIMSALTSPEGLDLCERVMGDEAEHIRLEYGLSDEDLCELLDNYAGDYRDRGIVGCVWDGWDDAARDEAFQLGYDERPYFDYDAFASDLQESDGYLELPSGRVAEYNY